MYNTSKTFIRVAAGVLQRPDGTILLLHRAANRQHEAGEWCVVSGHVEDGETPRAAIIREIAEELVGSKVGEPVFAGKPVVLESDSEQAVIYPFLFKVPQDVGIVIEAEHQAFQWINPTQLPMFTTVAQLRQDLVHLGLLPKKLVLGVVGRNASGKDTLAERLAERLGGRVLNISDQVRQLARLRNQPLTRENLHRISAEHMVVDSEYFSKLALEAIERSTDRVVVISGFRTVENVKTFRRYHGDEFVLVQTKLASDKKRYQRMRKRGQAKDPLTWEQFIEQERSEEQIFAITKTMSLAEVVVHNDHSLQEFYRAIDELSTTLLCIHYGA